MVNPDDCFPVAQKAELELDRRRFLGVAACAGALALAGEWLGHGVEAAATAPMEIPWTSAEGLLVGEARPVAGAGGREALVVRLDAARVVAFDRRCPHLGCPVVWAADRGRFECPCHHAAFAAETGRVLFGPPRRGLTRVDMESGDESPLSSGLIQSGDESPHSRKETT